MSLLSRIAVLSVLLFAFNTYAADDLKRPSALPDLPFRQSNFDYKLAWKTSKSDNGVVIDGKMKNIHFMTINSLELTVFLRGSDDKVRSRLTVLPMPQYTKRYDEVDFNLKLANAELLPGDVLEFVIHYNAVDGSRGLDWRSTFAADAITGVPVGKEKALLVEW